MVARLTVSRGGENERGAMVRRGVPWDSWWDWYWGGGAEDSVSVQKRGEVKTKVVNGDGSRT